MLHLVIADAEIERVPEEISHHRVICWHARRRGRKPTELILNSSLHYPAMRSMKDWQRRGRPDIAHLCLLLALDSPLNLEGHLKVYVHTREDMIIFIDPSTNLPRTSNRFEGLLEQLYLTGKVPPEAPLLTLRRLSLKELIDEISPERTIVFSEAGKPMRLTEIFTAATGKEKACVIVGGFPHGDFLSDLGFANEIISIYQKPLMATTVVAEIIAAYERSLGVM